MTNAKAFYFSPCHIGHLGSSMKAALAVVIVVLVVTSAGLMMAGCGAQNSSRFTSVGGEYGRGVISKMQSSGNDTAAAQSTAAAEEDSSGLWSWGSSPKGTIVVDGNLIGDPRYTMKKLNLSGNWLDETFVDPYETGTSGATYTDAETGEPVQTYVDTSGRHYYTYTDSSTKKLVYVYFDAQTGIPYYASFTPLSPVNTTAASSSTPSLPPIFTQQYPWS